MGHAILSASGAARWLACPPSAREEQQYPNESSAYAQEGTQAHALAEKHLKLYLKTGDSQVICPDDKEMEEAVQSYVDLCIEKIGEARKASPDALIAVEKKLNFSEWVPEGFGTGDAVILSDKFIEIIDLKYGKGVRVSAENNPQMRLYALGMWSTFGWLYGADQVRMTIVQPRLDSVSTQTVSLSELLAWGASIEPIAQMAYKGEGEHHAGDHCRFCRARHTCRERARAMKAVIRKDFAPGNALTKEEIASIVMNAQRVRNWLDDVMTYATVQAVDGETYPGLKLVHGRSIRKITDPDTVGKILEDAGIPKEGIYRTSLQTITELEKVCGRKKFNELVKDYIVKPEGKPSLVADTDKRQAIETKSIKDMFMEDD